MESILTELEKKALLDMAREAVVTHVKSGMVLPAGEADGALAARAGCFVCIKMNGTLRGCIGNFTSEKPLYSLVQEMAVAAATKDPRFYPMKQEDLDDFQVEISVLSALKKVESIEEIEVGVHGIYLEKNFSRGVLLPQVAVEYGWDRDTFLRQTSLKAGLEKDAWKDGAEIFVFHAEVFSDR